MVRGGEDRAMTIRLLPLLLSLATLGACAIAPPPPEADAIAAPALEEAGRIALADPAQAAFCVSQDMPESQVLLVQDGAAVRPAAGPDYALTLVFAAEESLAWRLLVAGGAADPGATATRLRRALAGCMGRLARST
jgi:hypothetical protein